MNFIAAVSFPAQRSVASALVTPGDEQPHALSIGSRGGFVTPGE